MGRENDKIPFYVRGNHYEICGPPLGISKAKFIKLLRSFVPRAIRNRLHNKFAEQSKIRMLQDNLSLFKIIHIETRTLCNGACSFCPAAAQYKSRPDFYMPKEMYSKIIDQLQLLNYRGRISSYCNNEPLIDERIYDFLKEARIKCPDSYLEVKTNGKNLDIEKLRLLIDIGVNKISINDYENTDDFSPNIKKIIHAIFENKLEFKKSKVSIAWRKQKQILQNRAGTSPNLPPASVPMRRFCSRPFEMITIGTEGQIGICSSDFNFQHTIVNIKDMSLSEAWHSSEYQRIRDNIVHGDRTCTVPCRKCDYHGYYPYDLKGFYRWIKWI